MNRRTFLQHSSTALAATAFSSPGLAQQAKQKTIVLQSGWATHNIGDIGHTPGTLRVLEQHLPKVKVVLWAMQLDERVKAMLHTRFPNVEILQGNLAGKSAGDEKLREAIRSADLYIRNSGMGQDTTFMQFCQKNGKPFGLFGQSYFPDMVEGKGADERKALLNSAAFIYTRETKSLAILKGAGLTTPILEFGPDGCLGIDVRDDARGLATMQKLGLEDRKFITLELRTHTPSHPGVDDKRPQKLNPLHPTPEMIADDDRRAAKYCDLITRWVKKTGHKVLIAPEAEKEMEYNKIFIYDRLPPEIQKHVVNLESFWCADEAASIFARAHTIVCHEPHSPIIGLANGTPIIHTYSEFHSPKCWMFKDIGLSEWLLEFDTTSVDLWAETLFAIDADYAGAQAKVKKAMAYVHECFDRSMQVVKKVINA